MLPTTYYQNPSWLTAAALQGPGALAAVTANICGNTLTIGDAGEGEGEGEGDAYIGTVTIYLTVSDGLLTNTQTFQVTFT